MVQERESKSGSGHGGEKGPAAAAETESQLAMKRLTMGWSVSTPERSVNPALGDTNPLVQVLRGGWGKLQRLVKVVGSAVPRM